MKKKKKRKERNNKKNKEKTSSQINSETTKTLQFFFKDVRFSTFHVSSRYFPKKQLWSIEIVQKQKRTFHLFWVIFRT